MPSKTTKYAVAVRDGADLWVFLSVERQPKGDVYIFWPSPNTPHASYHRSGRAHMKSGDKTPDMSTFIVRHRQPPTATFSGTEQIFTTPIWLGGARAMQHACRVASYRGGVCEIPAAEISPTQVNCQTAVAVDLVAPGAPPSVPATTGIRRCVFTNTEPHLSVTLWRW